MSVSGELPGRDLRSEGIAERLTGWPLRQGELLSDLVFGVVFSCTVDVAGAKPCEHEGNEPS
jgi:hypothetical protein